MADILPFISIIIPAFNEERYLPECLEAVKKLDYPQELFEILVIDNGSTDRTPDIAAEMGAVVLTDGRANVSGLRNLGAARAQGEILLFIDADCLVKSDMLNRASIYFGRQDIAAWGAPPIVPESSTWVQKAWYQVRRKEKEVEEVEWLESMNLFVFRDKFKKVDGFNEDLITCEDVDLCYRLKEHGRIISDGRIQVVHLGEAATVKEFFLKELWRGKGNFAGLRSHGLTLKELVSVVIPVYFGVFLPLLFLGTMFWAIPFAIYLDIAGLCMPSFMFIYRIRAKIEVSRLPGLLFLLQVYFLARTIAVIR